MSGRAWPGAREARSGRNASVPARVPETPASTRTKTEQTSPGSAPLRDKQHCPRVIRLLLLLVECDSPSDAGKLSVARSLAERWCADSSSRAQPWLWLTTSTRKAGADTPEVLRRTGASADIAPLGPPGHLKRCCRAKAQRNHNPRVGGSSPSSGSRCTARSALQSQYARNCRRAQDTRQLSFSASSTMIPAGPRT
jgi:hypothetical protein